MRIAARHPELVRSLVLIESAPDAEPQAHVPRYTRLSWVARTLGVNRMLADRVLPIMCGESFLNDPAGQDRVEALRQMLMQNKRSIYKAVRGVIERDACLNELGSIRCPTLVMHGTEDRAIARDRARLLVEHIEGAEWVDIEGAGHTSSLERPAEVTQALRSFLDGLG